MMRSLREIRGVMMKTKMKLNLIKTLCLWTALVGIGLTSMAQAQMLGANKVQLEDVSIKGEASKMGLNLFSRARNNLDGRILIRRDFRDRTLEDLPSYYDSKTLVQATVEPK
jgi:hypothetical protein